MRYMGSKARFSKQMATVIKPNTTGVYCEPFVGGCGMMRNAVAASRYGYDINPYIIAFYRAIQKGWEMPSEDLTTDEYKYLKAHKDDYPELSAYYGFGASFGGKFFGGQARGGGRCFVRENKNHVLSYLDNIKDVLFGCSDYKDILFTKDTTLYCDPPYSGTTAYSGTKEFNHAQFWKWCDDRAKEGHRVFVSEYSEPLSDGWEKVWQREVTSDLTCETKEKKKKSVEMLFYKSK